MRNFFRIENIIKEVTSMKKLVALLLLVCMVLSSTAALAELSAPGEYPISDEQYKLKIFTGQLAIFEDFETSYENKYVEELTNVDVEWQPFNSSEVNEKFNFSIADEKACLCARRTLPAKSPELTDNRIFARGQTIHRSLRNGFFKVSYTL